MLFAFVFKVISDVFNPTWWITLYRQNPKAFPPLNAKGLCQHGLCGLCMLGLCALCSLRPFLCAKGLCLWPMCFVCWALRTLCYLISLDVAFSRTPWRCPLWCHSFDVIFVYDISLWSFFSLCYIGICCTLMFMQDSLVITGSHWCFLRVFPLKCGGWVGFAFFRTPCSCFARPPMPLYHLSFRMRILYESDCGLFPFLFSIPPNAEMDGTANSNLSDWVREKGAN